MFPGAASLTDFETEQNLTAGRVEPALAALLGADDGNRLRAAMRHAALGGGKRYDTGGGYSDIDMMFTPDGYFHKDGTPYPTTRIP